MKGSKGLAIFFIILCCIGFLFTFLTIYGQEFLIESYRDTFADYRLANERIVYVSSVIGAILSASCFLLALIFIAIGEPEPSKRRKEVAIPELTRKSNKEKKKEKKAAEKAIKTETRKSKKALKANKKSRRNKKITAAARDVAPLAADSAKEISKTQSAQDFLNSLRG